MTCPGEGGVLTEVGGLELGLLALDRLGDASAVEFFAAEVIPRTR